MKIRICLLFLFLFSLLMQAQDLASREGIQDNRRNLTYAITNATIVVAPGERVEGTLLVTAGKIVAVGNNVAIPKHAVVIDAQKKFIYPSFIDLNSNYGLTPPESTSKSGGVEYERNDGKSAFGWNRAIRADQAATALYSHNEKAATELRAQGVGVVLSHHKDGIARGTGSVLALANLSEQHALLRPKAATFFSFDKGSSSQQYPSSQMGSIALLRQTFLDAQWYQKNKSTTTNLHLEALNAQDKLPHFFDSPDKLTSLRAVRLGNEFQKKFIILGSGDEYQALKDIQSAKAAFVIPMNFQDAPDVSDPFLAREIGLRDLKHWELAPYNFKALLDNGVTVALSPNGTKKLFEALNTLAETGVSETQLLAALTTTPASLIQMEKEIGTLKPGMRANFFIAGDSLTAKKNEIFEHWVLGERHIHTSLDKFDITGTYRLNGSDTLVLGQDKSFQLTLRDSLAIKGKYTFKNNKLRFQYAVENETFLFEATAIGDRAFASVLAYQPLSGKPNLTQTLANLAPAAEKDKKTTEGNDDFDYKTALWYPFQAFGHEQRQDFGNYLIKNATVWTLEAEGVLDTTDVLIANGKIARVGKALKAPKGYTEIDAIGLHLTPGMIDEHSHIAISRGVNESGSSSSAEVRIGDVINPEDINIYRQLAGGTTASQLLHGSANTIGGQSALVKLRWGKSAEEMKIENAPGYIKFALGENVKQSNWGDRMRVRYPQSRMGVEQVLYQSFMKAEAYGAEKKKNPNTRVDLEMETLLEILESRRFISCHSYVQSEINMLMHVADSMGFTVNTFTHVLEGYKVAAKLRKHGAAASTFSDWWAYKMEVNEAIPFNAAILTKAGVVTAINSDDAEMGRRLNQEAGKVMRYGGDDEVEALKTVTLNPAKMLRLEERIGSIKVGKDADLVLWDAHPLSSYAKVQKTFVDGQLLFDRSQQEAAVAAMRKERERLIAKAQQAANGGKPIAQPESEIDNEYHCDTLEEIHFHGH